MMVGLIVRAIHEFSVAKPLEMEELQVFWPVVIIIFIPIAIGFSIFGWYSIQNLYDKLPESSEELGWIGDLDIKKSLIFCDYDTVWLNPSFENSKFIKVCVLHRYYNLFITVKNQYT